MQEHEPSEDVLRRTATLIREFQAGNEEAFRRLYNLHHEPILRSVARGLGRHLKDILDPEDILQETFRLACTELERRSYQDFRTVGRFRLLLARIARQLLADAGRRESSLKRDWRLRVSSASLHEPELASNDPRPSEIAAGTEACEVAERALLTLAPHERTVLDLRDNLGLSYEEIAEAMDLRTSAAAKLRCTRARRRWEAKTRELLEG